jgi:hypothetical protein
MSSSGRPTKYMSASMVSGAGIAMTIQRKSWRADRIKASGAKRAWIYFNNDNDAHAPKNATVLRRMLGRVPSAESPDNGTLPHSQTFTGVRETVS